ncbi:hypothetical protein M5E06_17740 [Azospirillum sp. A1-3]|uniref:hypothetical protein n=1 Tax=Azospirillum sp. A1-3 TaxID=185874 RepID=UPI00207702B8|nr:hypothetical protein [Azospirillum sp. A1-3]MCM8735978.1 hypothetical protein [Azospirillum sp. A1-3]
MGDLAKAEALAAAAALDREAAELAVAMYAKLDEADRLRAPHVGWLEREMAKASAEVACWEPRKLAEFRAHYEAQMETYNV